MTRKSRLITTWTLLGLITCSALSTGCPIGGNTTVSFIAPAGLGGAPGFYNPFGITQAIVNALLGAGGSSGSASPNPVPNNSSGIDAAIPALAGTTQTAGVTP
jgi:hypothetical protein